MVNTLDAGGMGRCKDLNVFDKDKVGACLKQQSSWDVPVSIGGYKPQTSDRVMGNVLKTTDLVHRGSTSELSGRKGSAANVHRDLQRSCRVHHASVSLSCFGVTELHFNGQIHSHTDFIKCFISTVHSAYWSEHAAPLLSCLSQSAY